MDSLSNYYEFLTWPMEIQAAQVWKYGTFLERVTQDGKCFWLYSLYSFYVELVMSGDDETVLDVRPFMNARGLDKYLRNIDLNDLLAA